ncbi:hypothetical protein MCEGE10_01487 [Flavobacteriaceae bacterium]
MKKYIILLVVLASSLGFSQTVNDYKYAIVPSKFAFLKEKDQYRLNTLTKLLMDKYGFVTFFDTDILPVEVAENNCNKVFVEVQSNGNMFMTKLSVVLKDCKNTILFKSVEGKSREKEYQTSYNQALREAFNSFETLGYKYNGNSNDNVNTKENSDIKVSNLNDDNKKTNDLILFAQPIENGFQLIDSTPKVIMKIYKTSSPICFIANKNNIQGVLISKENQWFFEYISNSKLVSEKVEVKF